LNFNRFLGGEFLGLNDLQDFEYARYGNYYVKDFHLLELILMKFIKSDNHISVAPFLQQK